MQEERETSNTRKGAFVSDLCCIKAALELEGLRRGKVGHIFMRWPEKKTGKCDMWAIS